jgi:VanZ family protein
MFQRLDKDQVMSMGDVAVMWPSRKTRGLIWLVYTLSWSTALLVPVPQPPVEALRDPVVRFTLAKALHVSAYMLLALLTLWLRPAGAWRWLLLAFLLAHGILTEFFQWYFPSLGRSGCVEDVIRDWVGVSLGLALWFGWWFCGLRTDNPVEAALVSAEGGTLAEPAAPARESA